MRAAIRGAWVSAVLLITAACTSPLVSVSSDPAGASVWRDSRPVGSGTPLDFRAPYYGTIQVELDLPPSDNEDWIPRLEKVGVEPPISRWIFPFDFPLEAVLWVFGANDREVHVEMKKRPRSELTGERATELIKAATEAAVAR